MTGIYKPLKFSMPEYCYSLIESYLIEAYLPNSLGEDKFLVLSACKKQGFCMDKGDCPS